MNTNGIKKKRILFITTGGTIACRDKGHGLAPELTPEELLAAVPGLDKVCDVTAYPLFRLDSTDMTPDRWLKLAGLVYDAMPDRYDGYVITHGTDTLAYAAATLACQLQHSDKPIVLTGSQLPLEALGSDAPGNLRDAFTWALTPGARGVRVVFAGRVIRGLRVRMRHTTDMDAFESVGCADSAMIRDGQVIRMGQTAQDAVVTDSPFLPPVRLYRSLNVRIALVHLTPGLDPEVVWQMGNGLKALIVEGVGIGGIPESLTPVLTRLAVSGVRLVLTSQVPYGVCDFTVYRAGRRIGEAIESEAEAAPVAVTARDVPTEAAFAAAMYALAREEEGLSFAEQFRAALEDADL